MPRYLDPKYDLTFKKVFGEHKPLCISLLNALLPLDEGRLVKEIEYLPGELVPPIADMKDSIVDVRCVDNTGRQFIVEMQLYWTTRFQQRVLLNASKAYVTQFDRETMKSPNPYRLLKPVYALSFVNQVFEPETEEYYHHYAIVNVVNTEKRIEGLEMVFIELPKFKPENRAVRKLHNLWLRFMTEIDEGIDQAPPALLEQSETNDALHILEEYSYTRNELAVYDRYRDMVATAKTLYAGTREDALEEGHAKGETARARKNALAMLEDGLPPETVAKYSGLSIEEVAALAPCPRNENGKRDGDC